MTDGGDKPEKPDPFAPLPLATLPPVRGKDSSGPTPKAAKQPAETIPGTPTAASPRPPAPPTEAPAARTRAPSIPPNAFAQPAPPADDVTWTSSSGERVSSEHAPSGGAAALADLAELGPAGGPPASSGQVWETPAGATWTDTGHTGGAQAWSEAPAGTAAQAWTEAPAAAAPESPLLPQTYNEDELRDAVGATPRVEPNKKKRAATPAPVPDDDDDDDGGSGKRTSRRTLFVAAASIVMGGGIAALVLLGKVNSARYSLACEEDRVVVEQGRSFPPWGTATLDGAEWKPLKIPAETACHPRETEDRAELAGWYLKMLTDFADKQLSAREITKVDEAEAALKQALLVTRALRTDEDAKTARGDIDRLLGDVVYWRASARLKSASDALADAAKQFDAAATARPQHFKDAAEWAKYTRIIIDQLRAGPGGVPAATFPPAPPLERPTAPTGVALPVEPEGSGAEPPPPPAPDAGVPSGGVLL